MIDALTQNINLSSRVLYGDRLVSVYRNCPQNLDVLFRSIAGRFGDRTAVVDHDEILTYQELNHRVGKLAAGLTLSGVRLGDRVVLFIGNRWEFIAILYACWRIGAIAVPVGIRQSKTELTYIVAQCGAKTICIERHLSNRLPERSATPSVNNTIYLPECRWEPAIVGDPKGDVNWSDFYVDQPNSSKMETLYDTAPACIMYTSGTTGHPKGAVLSHLGFYHTARNYEIAFGYTADDIMLLAIPATHISGLLACIVAMMQVGGSIVCKREFKATDILATIEKIGITASVMVPAMYNLCLLVPQLHEYKLDKWRIGHFGGAAMPVVSIQRLADALPSLELYNGFGATETTSAVTLTFRGDVAKYPDSVGTALPGVDIKVLREDGWEVGSGESGELWIKSPGNAICYWDNVDASRTNFVAGYWRSGDIGSIDQKGYVRINDRLKDMINRGGFKIYSAELEDVIQRYPGILEVAVVGTPSPILGEKVHAFVYSGTQAVDLQGLKDYCRENVAEYKVPDYITISEKPLPRNLNGKIIKAPLREQSCALCREDVVEHNRALGLRS